MVKASGEATEAWVLGVLQHRSVFHLNAATEVTAAFLGLLSKRDLDDAVIRRRIASGISLGFATDNHLGANNRAGVGIAAR